MRMCAVCALAALGTVSAAHVAAQGAMPAAAALAKKVDAHYNHLTSLEAHYTERYRGMGLDRTETGTLLLRKPGRMKWSYDDPAGKVFVIDGKDAISYTPGDAQANRIPAKQLGDLESPLRFLLGHAELAHELQGMTLAPVMLDGREAYTLSGTPKDFAARVRTLSVTADANGVIRGLRIEETDGATTDFTFTGMRENVPAPDSDFSFTPPPGVTVVNGAAPI